MALPIPVSILDLAPIPQGASAAQALANTRDLARKADGWGYHRYWLAEHHNMPGIASAATAVVIGHVAGVTQRMRVGAGGIMLPNHAPLVIAEQFGTLDALFPGRIDLGIGRAPGTDPVTARALRRGLLGDGNGFADDVLELMSYLGPAQERRAVNAYPGSGSQVEFHILGSSLYGAELAAALGLPYSFASHFAPAHLGAAIELYRRKFCASQRLERPRVMLGVQVVIADKESRARELMSSLEQAFVALRTGRPGPLPPPVPGYAETLDPMARHQLSEILACSFVGTPATVAAGLEDFVARHEPDELIVASQIYDHEERLRSYQRLAEIAFG